MLMLLDSVVFAALIRRSLVVHEEIRTDI